MTFWLSRAIVPALLACPGCNVECVVEPSIDEVRARHEDRLMAEPGVISVGVARDEEGKAVIVVGLDRERPEVLQALPTTLEGYAVRAEVVGRIRSEE